MLIPKLAFRNLMGGGLRTWLNVIILSISFVVIIWYQGLLKGWDRQARVDSVNWEIGGGQYWHPNYDPFDPFSLSDSHGEPPPELHSQIAEGRLTPLLISQATIYPGGRIQSILLKGIDPAQRILQLPTGKLAKKDAGFLPVIIGTGMAADNKLKIGDQFFLRWRDASGVFDATEASVVGIFKTNVPAVDKGQLWVPLRQLQEMNNMPGEATLLVAEKKYSPSPPSGGWIFNSPEKLLANMDEMIRNKSIGASIFYGMLLAMAMLAIFDTQVLSIFRRRKEIGTTIALGMTRKQVVGLFTLEGALNAVLAAMVAAIYGIPLLTLQAVRGFSMPQGTDDWGMPIAEKIFPVYSLSLVLGTVVVVLITATIVSYLPSRKISRLNPTDAIRGKLQ